MPNDDPNHPLRDFSNEISIFLPRGSVGFEKSRGRPYDLNSIIIW